ncbi:MAG: HD domain-containing protein [Clostridia bacterium]|nr:HD domain-containing protein [Clostridia bacterium]
MRMRLLFNCINGSENQVEGFCVVKAAQVRSNVKGADYLDMTLFDADGEVNAKLWDYDVSTHGTFQPQDLIKVRGTVTLYRDQEQLRVERIRKATPADKVDLSELIPCAPQDSDAMYAEVWAYTELMRNDELKRISQHLLDRYNYALRFFPAALRLHHAVRGGLLFHTLTMLHVAKDLCATYGALYPALNADLVYAGIILHDIAKISELEVSDLGIASGYTAEGELLGHISIGVNLVGEAARELSISLDTCMLLQHIILSHHTKPEFGSPKCPMFPEAEIVSALDSLDAKLYEMYDGLNGVPTHGFSQRMWALDDRKLYNHGL